MRRKVIFGAAQTLALALAAQGLSAQAMGDGRTGPMVFHDTVLDQSLHAMNDFLQARYAYDAMMASLHTPAPAKDFETVARIVADVPERAAPASGGFGTSIVGGQTLDLHLASFNDAREERGEPLFVRVARMAAGTLPDFADVADIPPGVPTDHGFGEGRVHDDPTLNDSMADLFDHMQWQATRDEALRARGSAIRDGSFDRYGDALTLF